MARFVIIAGIAFQSTPSRRGRRFTDADTGEPDGFQSTPSRRGRPLASVLHIFHNLVSIHSLTQRETLEALKIIFISAVSIHSLTQRETILQCHDKPQNLFQSTPSRRGRRICGSPAEYATSFNPLPHAEGDLYFLRIMRHFVVSIHSLTQRETCYTETQ